MHTGTNLVRWKLKYLVACCIRANSFGCPINMRESRLKRTSMDACGLCTWLPKRKHRQFICNCALHHTDNNGSGQHCKQTPNRSLLTLASTGELLTHRMTQAGWLVECDPSWQIFELCPNGTRAFVLYSLP
ncbi:hypothetical protein CBL_07140 [Carabus blaptoides fortunei]